MSEQFGRLEKRRPLAVNVEISSLLDPSSTERACTENISSLGMRVVTQHRKELNECLVIRTLTEDLRAVARVVYCQRLSDVRFGIGIQFVKLDSNGSGPRRAAVSA